MAEAAPERPARTWRLPRLTTVVSLGLLLFAGTVVVGNVLPTRARLIATEKAVLEQERRNLALEDAIRAHELEAERLQHDPWTLERVLRDELRLAPEGDRRLRHTATRPASAR